MYEEESRRLEVVEEAERRSRLVERSDVLDEYIIRERDDVYGDDGTGILDTWTSATSRGIPGEHTPSLSLSAPACHWTLHASTGPLQRAGKHSLKLHSLTPEILARTVLPRTSLVL